MQKSRRFVVRFSFIQRKAYSMQQKIVTYFPCSFLRYRIGYSVEIKFVLLLHERFYAIEQVQHAFNALHRYAVLSILLCVTCSVDICMYVVRSDCITCRKSGKCVQYYMAHRHRGTSEQQLVRAIRITAFLCGSSWRIELGL